MSDSIHDNILRHQSKNVLKKYEVLHVLGTGSMGTVSMVKVKDSKIGGAALSFRNFHLVFAWFYLLYFVIIRWL